MRRTLCIARREYVATVCTKGFILGLILAPLMMGGGLLGVAVTQRQVRHTERSIVLIDHSKIVGDAVIKAAAARNRSEAARPTPGAPYQVRIVEPEDADPERQRLELSDQVRSDQVHAFVEVGPDVMHPVPGGERARIRYHSKNAALDEVRHWLGEVINDYLRRERLIQAGIDPTIITNLFASVSLDSMGLADRDARTGAVRAAGRQNEAAAVGVPIALAMLGMMLVMLGASPLLQSVMEEKTQRIAEVLLGAATPWEIMAGKLLGGVAVSLTAMAVYLGGAFITLTTFALAQGIPWSLLPWFVAFVVAAILMYGAVGAALGAACSDAKDAQNLQLPVILPVMIPMFLLLPMIKEPHGTLATGLSLFPPFTPLLMLMRLGAPGGIPWWQPWVGLLGVLACASLALWMGSRVFRIGILTQGRMPRLNEILRWGLRG